MALLIGTVTRREMELLEDAGWKPAEMSIAMFRRFFQRDPGYVEPGTLVVFVALNYTLNEIAAALGNGNDDRPRLRITGGSLSANDHDLTLKGA